MRRVHPFLLIALLLAVGCPTTRTRPDGGPDASRDGSIDALAGDAPAVDAPPPDAPPPDASGGDGGCGITCPPEMCVGGVCVPPGFCCESGYCAPGSRCDFDSCSCIPATGCCAGEACASGEVCSRDCRCVDEDNCCDFGCSFPETCDFGTCGCFMDTSCGPSCDGDRFCIDGECVPRCWFEGCADPMFICGDLGCVPPACTAAECAVTEPPYACDPGSGCFDPCIGSDWSWCESVGGHCVLGECVDDSCLGGMLACNYVVDCCGNWVCWDTSMGGEPFCDPSWCGPEPRIPPRPDLCRCATFGSGGYCADLYDGGVIIFPGGGPPPPPRRP